MAAILGPKHKVLAVNKTSTEAQDKANGGYGAYEIVAEVRFTLYTEAQGTDAVKELTAEANDKLDHALS